MKKKKPEILAPAGSVESLRAAVSAGCDAIYIGGSRFGARAYADNPAENEMIQAIEYCHLHGVKLYMTVNTLLKDCEMTGLYDYLRPYYEAGLDAVIVQDMGVLRMIHLWFPDLEIHASTQMNLTTGRGISLLKQYGVTRVVPARELTLSELEQMRKDTDMELEVFVHGALCYCYSGQCLLSSMQGGRSGNRGRCAQPCRMLYRHKGRPGYLLSPKELCNLPYVGELIEAGIDSFKIEGRMKRPEYTAFVTSLFRKYVDLYHKLGRQGYDGWQQKHQTEWQEDLRSLAELYNRNGFTQGYLEGKAGVFQGERPETKQMLSDKRPRHGGVLVGEVVSVDRHTAVFRLEKSIAPQDILEFRDYNQRTIYEYTVGEGAEEGMTVRARYQKGCHIQVGDLVYRTRHQVLLTQIRKKYLESEPRLPVDAMFTAVAGKRCQLTVWREDCSVTVEGEVTAAAQKRPALEEAVRKSIGQTGDSIFFFSSLDIALQGEVFLPVGELKKLRREALQQLQENLLNRYRRIAPIQSLHGQKKQMRQEEQGKIEKMRSLSVVSVMTWEQLEAVLEAPQASEIILRMDQIEDDRLAEGIQRIQATGRRAILGLPMLFRQTIWDFYQKQYERCQGVFAKAKPDGYLVHNIESFGFLREVLQVRADRIMTDANLYVMNEEAFHWWREQGVKCMTAPYELTGREWKALSYRESLQVMVYGHLPLMVSAQCVACNTSHCAVKPQERSRQIWLEDERRRKFISVNYCKYCYNMIYQGVPMTILDQKEYLAASGFAGCRYEFTVESGKKVLQILRGELPTEIERGHFELGIE